MMMRIKTDVELMRDQARRARRYRKLKPVTSHLICVLGAATALACLGVMGAVLWVLVQGGG